jgi:hypothetical protein
MRSLSLAVVLLVAPLIRIATAQSPKLSAPDVPAAIQAPSNEEVVLIAHANGSQIYTCQHGEDGKFTWTLKAPEAELKDEQGHVIGTHLAGPKWKLNDGSEVTGKAAAHVDSPEADSIQWLLVKVIGTSGNGILSKVTTIQRVHTHGGKAPVQGCAAEHVGAETKSSYTADYYFFAPTNQAK